MQHTISFLFLSLLLLTTTSSCLAQDNGPTTGPVFEDIGAVYSIDKLDYLPDTTQNLKAIFDVERKYEDPNAMNSVLSSLHRYYNMHVRYGFTQDKIQLVVVLHGGSTKDALSSSAYKGQFNTDNPNQHLIKTLSGIGVKVYLCGQSMSYRGYTKADLLPEVQVALSAMSVLTAYQMNGYALIKF